MRIGIFGGSFDPVHHGHLVAAECCREQAALDRVVFVPTAIQPFKQDRAPAAAHHRAEMLELAVGGNPAFVVSTLEIDRGGVSYTIDTLVSMREAQPADELLLILGADALATLPDWRDPEGIVGLAMPLAVERRGRDDVASMVREPRLATILGPARARRTVADRVIVPDLDTRSSDLRALLAAGRSVRYRTPHAVERYIAAHGLYRGV